MFKVTDQTRESVFEDFSNAEWYMRYYGSLADVYRKKHYWTRIALLTSVLVEAVVVVPLLSGWSYGIYAIAIASLIVIGLTVYDAISNHATHTAKLTAAHDQFSALRTEWRSLYLAIETDRIEEQQVLERQRELIYRTNLIGASVEVKQDKKHNLAAATEANRVMSEQYG